MLNNLPLISNAKSNQQKKRVNKPKSLKKYTSSIIKDLSLENKKLNDIIISNKLNFDEEIREIKNKAREEELKKHQQIMKSHEQKIKMMEEGKEVILRKNQ